MQKLIKGKEHKTICYLIACHKFEVEIFGNSPENVATINYRNFGKIHNTSELCVI